MAHEAVRPARGAIPTVGPPAGPIPSPGGSKRWYPGCASGCLVFWPVMRIATTTTPDAMIRFSSGWRTDGLKRMRWPASLRFHALSISRPRRYFRGRSIVSLPPASNGSSNPMAANCLRPARWTWMPRTIPPRGSSNGPSTRTILTHIRISHGLSANRSPNRCWSPD